MIVNKNSDFLFLFEATLTNPNGDPDQENKPRMDYETSTLLVSDARRKRDIRDFLKEKGHSIFVDTMNENKVKMDVMFESIYTKWLNNEQALQNFFQEQPQLAGIQQIIKEKQVKTYQELKNAIDKEEKEEKKKNKKSKNLNEMNNLFLTYIIQKSLVDIRMFGSAMAVEKVSRVFTGPIQITWGYSLHAVELNKSNTITSIMNDGNSTFGKKHKIHYGLIAHSGTVNKFSSKITGLTESDRHLFRKSLVQGMMNNQTDSKQGQIPLCYLEVIYNAEFDGYLGDLRRFLKVDPVSNKPIRELKDLSVDFNSLSIVIEEMKKSGYVDKVVGWLHPFAVSEVFKNTPLFEQVDLWESISVNKEN